MTTSILTMIFTSLLAYPCPNNLDSHKEAATALQWLVNHSGQKQLGDCQVEITHCDSAQVPSARSTIGEILMIDSKGREFYFNIRVPEKSVRKVNTKFDVNPYSLWVRQKNTYFEEENGRTEAWRLEIQSKWGDPMTLKRIEMGVYTTNSQLNQWWNGNDSHWMVCEQ